MPIFNDMTNKEAAKVLNDYSTVNRNASLPYINEAIHAAIKALDQIDNIKAQNAEYKTRLGIDETVVPKDADTKVEIVWYEWQEAPDVTWSSGSFTKLYGCMKQRGGEVYRITKTIYGKCVSIKREKWDDKHLLQSWYTKVIPKIKPHKYSKSIYRYLAKGSGIFVVKKETEDLIVQIPCVDRHKIMENAELINRNHKAIRVYPKPIILEVDSKFAGFTIPGMRVEGVTYEVPTFSALKGAIDAIYWHPGVETIPTAVYIHNPIKKERITQNGYNEGRGQRSRECLVNVRYTIIVYLVQMNTMQEGMNLDKYYEMLTKYINGGCGNKVPYLGIAMDPMNFKLINSDDIKPTQPFNEDLGFMPFTEDYTKPKDPDLVCRHLTIENGIIDFTKGEYFHCYEGLT